MLAHAARPHPGWWVPVCGIGLCSPLKLINVRKGLKANRQLWAFALVNSSLFSVTGFLSIRRGGLLVQDVVGRNTVLDSVRSHLSGLSGWCAGSSAKGCLF